jgi:hypothetical protein
MTSVRPGVEYRATTEREPSFGDVEVEVACEYLETWFEARHRTRFCAILVERAGDLVHFEITHGKTPLPPDLVEEPIEVRVMAPANDERSSATYDEQTGALVVRALDFINEGIRTSLGQGFFGDADAFTRVSPSSVSFPPATA